MITPAELNQVPVLRADVNLEDHLAALAQDPPASVLQIAQVTSPEAFGVGAVAVVVQVLAVLPRAVGEGRFEVPLGGLLDLGLGARVLPVPLARGEHVVVFAALPDHLRRAPGVGAEEGPGDFLAADDVARPRPGRGRALGQRLVGVLGARLQDRAAERADHQDGFQPSPRGEAVETGRAAEDAAGDHVVQEDIVERSLAQQLAGFGGVGGDQFADHAGPA